MTGNSCAPTVLLCVRRGSDGQMIYYLTSSTIMSCSIIRQSWTPKSLLLAIASGNPSFSALIDTGALITGMSNYEVAHYLLTHGLPDKEGVVFLDELDRKMILIRSTMSVLPLAQSGVPDTKRFAFYDQVHTTGMDIGHSVNACAVITLGKDMVFRDYAQGAFRMRGIGRGQTLRLLLTPEILKLMRVHVSAAGFKRDYHGIIDRCTEDPSSPDILSTPGIYGPGAAPQRRHGLAGGERHDVRDHPVPHALRAERQQRVEEEMLPLALRALQLPV